MSRTKMGISVRIELVDELDLLVDECTDLGASRPEIVEAILIAYLQGNEEKALAQFSETR